ncbi:hypothetical protein EZS27_013128 [termite gut metagenome]|uniref:Uncharacterized protein n=1 Tax=termite gut metagenome TaxID=433724 RepID=A0A5J4S0T3_9ZZZZ
MKRTILLLGIVLILLYLSLPRFDSWKMYI